MRCSQCGATVPNDAEVCPQCGATLADADQGGFTPGPSFTEDATSEPAADELPSWLRSFAEAAGDGAVPADPASPAEQRPSGPARGPEPPRHAPAPSAANLLSDEDLPEWLRSLGGTDANTEGADSATEEQAETIGVPTVSRAWVSGREGVTASSDANLFATVAQTLDARPEAATAASPDLAAAPARSATPGSRPAAPTTPAAAPVKGQPAAAAGRQSNRRLRVWLLIALLVLVIVLLFLLTRS